MEIKTAKYSDFTVYYSDEVYNFVHIYIDNENKFYEKFINYFLDEDRFLKYIENDVNVTFDSTKKHYAKLYKYLKNFIDEENEKQYTNNYEKDILKILCEEFDVLNITNQNIVVRLDKIGKFGEYIFNCILNEYFKFECIIPKIELSTSRNMSVFGIDNLHYSPSKKMVLFGESKVSYSLDNAIKLLNESLKDYDKRISDEYLFVISKRNLEGKLKSFEIDFREYIDTAISFEKFVEKSKLEFIGVPLFIAYQGNETIEEIFNKYKKLHKQKLFDLETIYYFITLPIIDKNELFKRITLEISKREGYYEAMAE